MFALLSSCSKWVFLSKIALLLSFWWFSDLSSSFWVSSLSGKLYQLSFSCNIAVALCFYCIVISLGEVKKGRFRHVLVTCDTSPAGPKKWQQHATYWCFGKKAWIRSSYCLLAPNARSIYFFGVKAEVTESLDLRGEGCSWHRVTDHGWKRRYGYYSRRGSERKSTP